jgi:hypothetical protein
MNRRGEDHTDKANLPVLCFDKKFRNDLFRQSKDLYTNPEDKVAVVTTPSGTVEWKRPISVSFLTFPLLPFCFTTRVAIHVLSYPINTKICEVKEGLSSLRHQCLFVEISQDSDSAIGQTLCA